MVVAYNVRVCIDHISHQRCRLISVGKDASRFDFLTSTLLSVRRDQKVRLPSAA